ncbi:MAG TPA: phage tail protein [Stellaceae bacterium]
MGILFGGGSRVNQADQPATSLRVQTAINGQPVAIVHGQNRLAGDLVWYGGFTAGGGGKGGGKGGGGGGGGGGKGGKGGAQPNYTADVIIGLCEGPIFGIGTVWDGGSLETTAKLGLTVVDGWQAPQPWTFLVASYPRYALTYSSLAYVGAAPMQLGSSPSLPNLNFEILSALSCAVSETYSVTSPHTFTPSYFTLSSSVTERITIPATAPFQYQALNPEAQTHVRVLGGGLIKGSSIPGGASQGVIGDDGLVFTRVTGTPAAGQYAIAANAAGWIYTFAAADAGTAITIIDLAIGPAVFCAYPSGADLVAGSATISIAPTIIPAGGGQLVFGPGIPSGTVTIFASGSTVILSQPATATLTGASLIFVATPLHQVLGTPAAGQFSVSVQPGTYGQYQFATADNGKVVFIVDVPDANPAESLTDYLTNPRYGCGFPAANLFDLTTLEAYAYATGMFISPALVSAQAANDFLKDFATALNGEFVWSAGQLDFEPYGDATITAFGKTYVPASEPWYALDDDDFLKNEGTASVGVSAFTGDDPVVCVVPRLSDAANAVKVEYLDRGNSYNPYIVEAQDDAAINAYGLRPADTTQLHFFCSADAAMMSAQLRLGRQQVRNLYSFTVPWYFILLDPMDIVAINDSRLGLVNQWVRIREITENQQDGTLTITAEEYLQGTGSAGVYAAQPGVGYVPNLDISASPVN